MPVATDNRRNITSRNIVPILSLYLSLCLSVLFSLWERGEYHVFVKALHVVHQRLLKRGREVQQCLARVHRRALIKGK